jgi:3',5'-cyclic-AMP phosphodiesterase
VTLPRPVEPELISVGSDEVVITAESGPDVELVTRVGAVVTTTRGPHHVVRITGLEPDTDVEVDVEGVEPHPYLPARVRTLARPPGRLLATIATANDVHFGETICGATGDPAQDAKGPLLSAEPGDPPYPAVMNAAVIDEMRALAPDAVVVKGDLTARGTEEEYADFLEAYGVLGAMLHHVRGNHDAMVSPTMAVQDAPYAVDVGGLTLAVLDTVIPGTDAGQLPAAQAGWLGEVADASTQPVLVFGHHPCFDVEHGSRTGRPYFGIQPEDSDALVEVFAAHDNLVGYFAGHTHRNRVRRFERARRVPFAEVGCTKDYPGAWAEYRVHEGGYAQVVRRVGVPDAFAWAERTRGMYEGAYRDYALGPLEHRCFAERF